MSNYFHTPVRDVDENSMVDGDDPEVNPGNASGNRQTNIKPETKKDNGKNSLQRTRQGIFTRGPPSILRFSNKFTVAFQFLELEKARLARLQEHLKEVQGIERRPAASLISPRDKISELHSGIPAFLPDFQPLARDSLPIPAAAVDPNVNSGAFPPPAFPYLHQSHSASDGSVKRVRKREYLEEEDRGTGFYEGAMNSTQGGREGAYSGRYGNPFLPLAGSSISGVPVPHNHQSHSESDRPFKKARTKYHSDVEKERGFYHTPEDMIMDESGNAEGAYADGRRRDPNTVGKVFYMDESPSFSRNSSLSPPSNW